MSRDPRACAPPPDALASARDTAAFCAEQFVERNGYTDVLPAGDRDSIALESTDLGSTLQEALDFRRNTLRRGPLWVCARDDGFSVIFHSGIPNEERIGRLVTMTRAYDAMRLQPHWITLDKPSARCARPFQH